MLMEKEGKLIVTLQQIKSFCMIAEYENITKASEALYITQPALSMALSKIENELGVPLFDRSKRSIQLNENGRIFYHFARNTLDDWDITINKLRANKKEQASLRFCYSSAYLSDYVLPAFISDNPGISIDISEVKEDMIPSLLDSGVFDIALSGVRHDRSNSTQLISRSFAKNQLLVSVPEKNPLSARDSLTLKDLQGQNFIRLSKQGEFTTAVNEQAQKEGVAMAVSQHVNYEVIKALQKKIQFLYFVTLLQAQFDYIPDNRKLIPVKGKAFSKDMYATFLKKNEKKAKIYIDWANTHLLNSVEDLNYLYKQKGV